MEQSQLTAANIRAECARRRITGRELARRLGENPMWLHRRLAGQQEISVDDVARIAAVLDLDPSSLLKAAS